MTNADPSIPAAAPATRGIDVSHFQGAVDWGAVAAAGIDFAFIKATEGLDDVDPRFHQNWQASGAAGLLRGAYHFLHPDLDARRQAAHFLSVVRLDDDALPPALDVEVSNGVGPAALGSCVATWLDTVAAALGCKPVVYTDPWFWRAHVAADLASYPLWLACYAAQPALPPDWQRWTFWQHSQSGEIAGIAGPVDLDRCQLSRAQLRQMRST
jgi:lysozyme